MLSNYNLPMPDDMTKAEIIDLLLKEEYGYLPPKPLDVTAEIVETIDNFAAGKAIHKKINLKCSLENGEFTFPMYYSCPKGENKQYPCFIHINFRDLVPDIYQPTEEIIDAGYAVLSFCYKDVSSDDGDFSNGLAGVVYPDGEQSDEGCGKIGLWAWAAMRVMDYAHTLDEIDKKCISVCGHSRLGKTALLTGALDERFFCAFSNNSGNSGAALSRNNTGETIEVITRVFPYWFCKNYKKYANNENSLPFDQHYLIGANVPHRVYVASALGDEWACPKNEYRSCIGASSYYEKNGLKGFVYAQREPVPGDFFHDGYIGYHMRSGTHYLSREDWQYYIRYINSNRGSI